MTYFQLHKVSKALDIVNMNSGLVMHDQMTSFFYLPFDAHGTGQDFLEIDKHWASHKDNQNVIEKEMSTKREGS